MLTPDEIHEFYDGQIETLRDRNEKLEAVVKALAESDPVEITVTDEAWCVLCGLSARLIEHDRDHYSSCPWRMARELVEET